MRSACEKKFYMKDKEIAEYSTLRFFALTA